MSFPPPLPSPLLLSSTLHPLSLRNRGSRLALEVHEVRVDVSSKGLGRAKEASEGCSGNATVEDVLPAEVEVLDIGLCDERGVYDVRNGGGVDTTALSALTCPKLVGGLGREALLVVVESIHLALVRADVVAVRDGSTDVEVLDAVPELRKQGDRL